MAQANVCAEMGARVWKVVASTGDDVAAGDELLILECMKTEIPVTAPCAGRIVEVAVEAEAMVVEGQTLVVIDAPAARA